MALSIIDPAVAWAGLVLFAYLPYLIFWRVKTIAAVGSGNAKKLYGDGGKAKRAADSHVAAGGHEEPLTGAEGSGGKGKRESVLAARAADAYNNVFEMPVVFFFLCVAIVVTQGDGKTQAVLGWLYVALRVIQGLAHVTINLLPVRSLSWVASNIVLMVMWGLLAHHIWSSDRPNFIGLGHL